MGVIKVFCKQYHLSQISIPDLPSYLLQSFCPLAHLCSTAHPQICCLPYRPMHCIHRAAATSYQIISKSNFWQMQAHWWWKTSSVMELTNQNHRTTDQVDRHWVETHTLAVSCAFLCLLSLPPSPRKGVWVWSSQPRGRWRNCLQLRWEYFIRLPTNGVHWILICQQSTDKKEDKVSTGHPVRSPQELVCFGSTCSR